MAAKLSEIAENPRVVRVFLGLLPQRLSSEKNWVRKSMKNELIFAYGVG